MKELTVKDTGKGFMIEGYDKEMFRYRPSQPPRMREIAVSNIERIAKAKKLEIIWM